MLEFEKFDNGIVSVNRHNTKVGEIYMNRAMQGGPTAMVEFDGSFSLSAIDLGQIIGVMKEMDSAH